MIREQNSGFVSHSLDSRFELTVFWGLFDLIVEAGFPKNLNITMIKARSKILAIKPSQVEDLLVLRSFLRRRISSLKSFMLNLPYLSELAQIWLPLL